MIKELALSTSETEMASAPRSATRIAVKSLALLNLSKIHAKPGSDPDLKNSPSLLLTNCLRRSPAVAVVLPASKDATSAKVWWKEKKSRIQESGVRIQKKRKNNERKNGIPKSAEVVCGLIFCLLSSEF